jgi:O-antigen/teichoic acid export membrane protein
MQEIQQFTGIIARSSGIRRAYPSMPLSFLESPAKTASVRPRSLQARIVSGSFILLTGSGLATILNFIYNVAIARFLGPQGFGDATVVYTLLTLLSAITLSFQIVSAKIVAQQKTVDGKYAGYRGFHWGAWICGAAAALTLFALRSQISSYLNLPSSRLLTLLAFGVAFYVPLGSRRGYLQGAFGFRRLAGSLVLEGAARLGGSLLMVLLGQGVAGVIAANSAAVAVAYLAIHPERGINTAPVLSLRRAFREMFQALVFYAGQMLINNCDIVLVKHFFLPDPAGLYAAVAMVGRVVFSLSSAVVNSMFPLVAGTRDEERKDLTVIATSLLMVLAIGLVLALGLRFAPDRIWTMFFGAKFHIAGEYGLPYLLSLYAITTVVYSLSAVIITYEMSYKIANTSWIQLVSSGVVILGIYAFHSTLREVIVVQLVLMTALLLLIAVPFFYLSVRSNMSGELKVFPPVDLLRPVTEDEAIAEFLRSDFSNSTFAPYHAMLGHLVHDPDLTNEQDNATRRALFFVRHGALWNELPEDTQWYEIRVAEADLKRIRVFPRGQWRPLSQKDFSVVEVVDLIRNHEHSVDGRLLTKIREIGQRLEENDPEIGVVILIGMDTTSPLTILDGNHRLVAALLSSNPTNLRNLHFLCGLSPRMMECCWYNSNFVTLLRYGKNVLGQLYRRPKEQLARRLQVLG